MLNILLRDTHIPKVFVGDPKQAIYEWKGSIDAFKYLPSNNKEYLKENTYNVIRIKPKIKK